jgi:DNA-binding NarL/FixJ family response regulator
MPHLLILIADDHAVVRAGLRTLLESRTRWQVCAEAADGRDAVEKAAKSSTASKPLAKSAKPPLLPKFSS